MHITLICKNCRGLKLIGEPYYALGTYYIDVTCVMCSHSVDITVDRLNNFLSSIEKTIRYKDASEKTVS